MIQAAALPAAAGLAPVLTPHGRLRLVPAPPALPLELVRRLEEAFARGAGHGLLQLGASEVGTALPAVLSYWRELGSLFVTAVCVAPDAQLRGVCRLRLRSRGTGRARHARDGGVLGRR